MAWKKVHFQFYLMDKNITKATETGMIVIEKPNKFANTINL